jgi:hypothetical protein
MSPDYEQLAKSISELPQLMSGFGAKLDRQTALMETAFRPQRKPKA